MSGSIRVTLSIGLLVSAVACGVPRESGPDAAAGPVDPAQVTNGIPEPTPSGNNQHEVVHIRGEITRVSPAEAGAKPICCT